MSDNHNSDKNQNSRIVSFESYKKDAGQNAIHSKTNENEKIRIPSSYIHPELDQYIETYYQVAAIKEAVLEDMYDQLQEAVHRLNMKPTDFKPDMSSIKMFMNLNADVFINSPNLPSVLFSSEGFDEYDYYFETMIRRDEKNRDHEWLCGIMTRKNPFGIWHYNLDTNDWDCVYEVKIPKTFKTILQGADCSKKRFLKELLEFSDEIRVKDFNFLCSRLEPLMELEERYRDRLKYGISESEEYEEGTFIVFLQPKDETLGGFGVSWDADDQIFGILQVLEENRILPDAMDPDYYSVRRAYRVGRRRIDKVLKHLLGEETDASSVPDAKELHIPLSDGVYLLTDEYASRNDLRFAGKKRDLNVEEATLMEIVMEELQLPFL